MQSKYVLNFAENEVLTINLSDGEICLNKEQMIPWGLNLKQSDLFADRLHNIENFKAWCALRTLSTSKTHAKKIFNALGISQDQSISTKFALAVAYHCTSLDDAYWVSVYGESVSWYDVCLHLNSSVNVLTPVSLKGTVSTVFNKKLNNSFDLSVNGTFAKSWIRELDGLYLYKADEQEGTCETAQEVKASKILDLFDVPSVQYVLTKYQGTPVSKCKCFTSEKVSFIPFREFKKYCKKNGKSAINEVKKNFPQEYANMIVMNYLIGNEDLHDGNWGFSLCNESFQIIGLAPLFDFNYALTPDYTKDNAKNSMCIPEQIIIDSESGKEILDSETNEYDYEIVSNGTLEQVAIEQIQFSKFSIKQDADIDSLGLTEAELAEFRRRLSVLKINLSESNLEKCNKF